MRRVMAGIYTGSKTALSISLTLFLLIAVVLFSPGQDMRTLVSTLRPWIYFCSFIGALIAFDSFLFRPIAKGSTRGHERFGIVVRPVGTPEGKPGWAQWFLRLAGHLTAAIWPIPVALWLHSLSTKQDYVSVADRISSLRQYESGEPPLWFRNALSAALRPAVIALIPLFLYQFTMLWQIDSQPRQSPKPVNQQVAKANPAREAGPGNHSVRQNSLDILADMEQRHLREKGGYTEDLEALVMMYRNESFQEAQGLLRTIHMSRIRTRMTDRGIELWAEVKPGDWQLKELRK
jgi:hypothetical protein